MYTWKYLVTGIDSEDDEKVKSCLEAKFMFGQETTPKDRKKVRKRMSTNTWVWGNNNLRNYLIEDDFSEVSTLLYQKENKEINIEEYLFKLSFDLKVEANGEVPRKEMFDLDALNKFILTGEIK